MYGRAVLVQNLGLFRDYRDGLMVRTSLRFVPLMISEMKTTQIEPKIEHLKQQLTKLGPMHPGSLRDQYNVCGKPGSRCKDSKNPQEHGPYYQLSFTWRGKGRTGFVRTEHLAEVRQKLANYKRFRELTDDWVDLVVDGAARTGEKPVGRWKSILRTYRRK